VLDRNGNFQMDPGEETAPFGVSTDDALAGDWTGDGITKVGVFRPDFRDPTLGLFSLDFNGNFTFDGPQESFIYGLSTDAFAVGDWGGTGRESLAALRPDPDGSGRTQLSLDSNGNFQFDPGIDQVTEFGTDQDYFVAGRWKPPSALRALGGALDPM